MCACIQKVGIGDRHAPCKQELSRASSSGQGVVQWVLACGGASMTSGLHTLSLSCWLEQGFRCSPDKFLKWSCEGTPCAPLPATFFSQFKFRMACACSKASLSLTPPALVPCMLRHFSSICRLPKGGMVVGECTASDGALADLLGHSTSLHARTPLLPLLSTSPS